MPLSETQKLSIIIVNYKTPELCIDCLKSVRIASNIDLESIVVDNASNDGSTQKIGQAIVAYKLIDTTVLSCINNGGFSVCGMFIGFYCNVVIVKACVGACKLNAV